MGLTFSVAGCAADEIIDCADLCLALDDCFDDNVDTENCVDKCEDEAEVTITTCEECLDEAEGMCMECSAECDPFTVLL